MGRAAVAGLLLATLAKDEERVTLQILGQGPLGAVTVDASGAGTARVFVTKPQLAAALSKNESGGRASIGDAVGRHGVVNVIRDLGMGQDFNGQTPIVDGEIDTDVESYLCRSEQIDSALVCEAQLDEAGAIRVAAGVLVQALPHSDGSTAVAAARARFREGVLARLLARSATAAAELTPAELLAAGLAEDAASLKRLDERPVVFQCPCSRERAASTLAMLGEQDLLDLIREEGEAEVTCEFCRARYLFTDTALEEIRQSIRRNVPPPS